MEATNYKVIIKSSGLEINRRKDGSHTNLQICDDVLQEGDVIEIKGKARQKVCHIPTTAVNLSIQDAKELVEQINKYSPTLGYQLATRLSDLAMDYSELAKGLREIKKRLNKKEVTE